MSMMVNYPSRERVRLVPCPHCGVKTEQNCIEATGDPREANHWTRIKRWGEQFNGMEIDRHERTGSMRKRCSVPDCGRWSTEIVLFGANDVKNMRYNVGVVSVPICRTHTQWLPVFAQQKQGSGGYL